MKEYSTLSRPPEMEPVWEFDDAPSHTLSMVYYLDFFKNFLFEQ